MATGHEYLPLNHEQDEIRLLSIWLQPVAENEPLVFEVERANLAEEGPNYIAVSYVWGDATRRRNIVVDGRGISVPENAEIALRRLHHATIISLLDNLKPDTNLGHRRGRFWIDSVCINQADTVERGHQVSIMWKIYSEARFVLIWLGPDDGQTKAASEAIDSIVADMWRDTNEFQDAESLMWDIMALFRGPKFGEVDLNHLDWSAIEAFYASSWFRRLWVWLVP